MLAAQSHTAGQIASSFGTCQSTVSEHLGVLRRAGVVTYAQDGGRRIYSLDPARLRAVAEWASAWYSEPA
jgi:ArsR family transcriptional regulator